MAFEHTECDAEEDIESIEEQDIPYAEKRLTKKKIFFKQNVFSTRLLINKIQRSEKKEAHVTSTGRQSVKRERNHEKQIAGRSIPNSVRCAANFGMFSCT